MNGLSRFFLDYYKSLTKRLPKQQYEDFINATEDYERITILYPYCEDMMKTEKTPVDYGKSYEDTLLLKNYGNLHFGKYENEKALEFYNKGILKCPQNSEESNQLLSILIANRSACLFDLKEYEKTIDDIQYAMSFNSYPEELKYKLYLRKAKCFTYITNKKHLAEEQYKKALLCLDDAKLDKEVLKIRKKEIKEALKEIKSYTPPLETKISNVTETSFIGNPLFPNASIAVTFDVQPNLGRFARATRAIACGETLIDEPAYCAVIAQDFTLTNCHYCTLATNKPVACKDCSNIIFCSLECQTDAYNYHKFECGLQPSLFASGASINCYMALRIITQQSDHFFEQLSELKPSGTRSFRPFQPESKGYSCVYKLCRNEDARRKEEYIQYTMMALYLLSLLKKKNYFAVMRETGLTPTEVFVASLILHHLQILQYNAHEVSELREAPPGPLDPKDEPNFKAVYIGAGLYPTLALFNHSCDPGIVRYNIGSRMIVKAIKFIREGEIIYENYGPMYTNTPLEERKKFLFERYFFDCQCQPCTQNWSSFTELKEMEVKIPCSNQKCDGFFYLDDDITSFVCNCVKCQHPNELFAHFKALTSLENILPKAELLYKQHKYDEATDMYLKVMKIYFEHTLPPFPDWIKVQQRLRTCMVSKGNKSIDYCKIRGGDG